jgi:hypothetical protein
MIKLREIAYTRSGDKGDINNVCVFPYDTSHFEHLKQVLDVGAIQKHFGELVRGEVERFEYPLLSGLNFVLHESLAGGVSLSLRTDMHGKAFQSLMLDLEIPEPDGWVPRALPRN